MGGIHCNKRKYGIRRLRARVYIYIEIWVGASISIGLWRRLRQGNNGSYIRKEGHTHEHGRDVSKQARPCVCVRDAGESGRTMAAAAAEYRKKEEEEKGCGGGGGWGGQTRAHNDMMTGKNQKDFTLRGKTIHQMSCSNLCPRALYTIV